MISVLSLSKSISESVEEVSGIGIWKFINSAIKRSSDTAVKVINDVNEEDKK